MDLNSYYIVYYYVLCDVVPGRGARQRYPLRTLNKGNEIKLVHDNDIALFYAEKGTCHACLMNGEEYTIERSIGTLADELDTSDFFKINRSAIVNRRAIGGFRAESSNRLLLRLKVKVSGDFRVSQRNVRDFKQWLR